MAVRSDVWVDFNSNPRIVWVKAPSATIAIQDLLDTSRSIEAELVNNSESSLIFAEGKSDLGGGKYTGITATFLNTLVAFEARTGPSYIQCSVTDGNLVANDIYGLKMPPIYPTAFTQVVYEAATSAALIQSNEIQYASYQNVVTIDDVRGEEGTTYPVGTKATPVLSLDDAYIIAGARGFTRFCFVNSYSIDAGDGNLTNFSFEGDSPVTPLLTIQPTAALTNCKFFNVSLTGYLAGVLFASECNITTASYIAGSYERCEMGGIVVLSDGFLHLDASYSSHSTPFVIDCISSSASITLTQWAGYVTIKNAKVGQQISINSTGGTVVFDATCAAAQVKLSGVVEITDNTNGVIQITDYSLNKTNISNTVWSKPVSSMSVVGSIGAYISKRLLTLQQFLALGSSGGGSGGGSNDGVIIGLLNSILALVGSGGGGSGTSMYPYSWPTIATAGAQTLTMPTPFTGIFSLSINGLTQPIGSYSLVSNVLTLPSQLNLQVGDTVSADILT